MKRFVVAAALAVALGFGASGRADAQIVYGYSGPVGTGYGATATYAIPGGYKTYNQFYSPYLNMYTGNTYAWNMFGQAYARQYAYNPWFNYGYSNSFYQPNYYMYPNMGLWRARYRW